MATTVLRSEVGRRNLAVLLADRVGLAADIKVDFLVVRSVIGVSPSLAASFNRRAHLTATSMLLHCQCL